MAKLDENYLNLIRNSLYNPRGKGKIESGAPLSRFQIHDKNSNNNDKRNNAHSKRKQVSLFDTKEWDVQLQTGETVKNRNTSIKSSTRNESDSITKKIHLQDNSTDSIFKKKNRKRPLTLPDSSESMIKRKNKKKKHNPINDQSIRNSSKTSQNKFEFINTESSDFQNPNFNKELQTNCAIAADTSEAKIKRKMVTKDTKNISKSTNKKSVKFDKNLVKSSSVMHSLNTLRSKLESVNVKRNDNEVAPSFQNPGLNEDKITSTKTSDTSEIMIQQKKQTPITKSISKTLKKKKVKHEDSLANDLLNGWSVMNFSSTSRHEPKSVNAKSRYDKDLVPFHNPDFTEDVNTSKKQEKNRVLKESKRNKYKNLNIQKPNVQAPLIAESTKKVPSVNENMAEIYDKEEVAVKGLKFNRFINLFSLTHNEQFQKSNAFFTVPTKYFVALEGDNIDWTVNDDDHIKLVEEIVQKAKTPKRVNDDQHNDINSVKARSPQKQHSFITPNKEYTDLVDNSICSIGSPECEKVDQVFYPANIINLKDGCKVVVLKHLNQFVHFNGLCYLKVLNGEVEILGACLNTDSGEQKVYSPRGTSLLYIRNNSKFCENTNIQLKDLIAEALLNTNNVNLSFEQYCAILLCRPLKEPYINFIEKHISQRIFPESNDVAPRLDCDLLGYWNKIQVSKEWERVLENESVSGDTKIVVCGGKNVGKSTFLRYAANVLLKKCKKIRIMELDPGQSEFYPPGCISATTVDNYILGPNYTHLQAVNRSILTHINMGHNVKQYLNSVKHLVEAVELMEKLPTLINLPGYTQEIGLNITASTLKLLLPTLVIEIKSRIPVKNYKMDMTSTAVNDFLNSNDLLNHEHTTSDVDALDYNFIKLNSLVGNNKAWSLEARQAREICILSYFGKTMKGNVIDLMHPAVNMFSILISALKIMNLDGNIISPLAINCNIVALCSTTDSQLFITYGYGFVRGMDLETDTLVLLTPELPETMENVSHLVLSSTSTPPSMIMSASGVKGHIPFVSMGELVNFGQFTKRSYLPPRK